MGPNLYELRERDIYGFFISFLKKNLIGSPNLKLTWNFKKINPNI
jgi:hypothetical protein